MTAAILTPFRYEVPAAFLELYAEDWRRHLARGVPSNIRGQLWERISEGKTA
jgi:hypothetical protein